MIFHKMSRKGGRGVALPVIPQAEKKKGGRENRREKKRKGRKVVFKCNCTKNSPKDLGYLKSTFSKKISQLSNFKKKGRGELLDKGKRKKRGTSGAAGW